MRGSNGSRQEKSKYEVIFDTVEQDNEKQPVVTQAVLILGAVMKDCEWQLLY